MENVSCKLISALALGRQRFALSCGHSRISYVMDRAMLELNVLQDMQGWMAGNKNWELMEGREFTLFLMSYLKQNVSSLPTLRRLPFQTFQKISTDAISQKIFLRRYCNFLAEKIKRFRFDRSGSRQMENVSWRLISALALG
ncbi:hypothetical protein CDAR_454311 [Caerostris darwini]|uniref:Maturase K n=1 Tax=Caerostris darwini TaxID=1538125 RepID=A0AAV4V7L5_9ARAC|nr:hypothetical protein CDAR_454311 [Caerostris darwini]